MVVSRKMVSGFGGTARNLDICLSVDGLGSISYLANHAYGGERVSGILLAISIADLSSSISFEALFMVTEIWYV